MSTSLRPRHNTLALSIIVVLLTAVGCAGPKEENPGVIPSDSSPSSATASEFAPPPPEPTGPQPGDNQDPRGGLPPEPTGPQPGGNQNPRGGLPPEPTGPQPGDNTDPYVGPPPEPAGPLTGGNTDPVGRTVTVAGPTPDNRYQEVSWGAFISSGEKKCTSITNSAQVDVRITGVRIADQQPSSPTAFRVFSPADCNGGLESVGSCLDGPTLPPAEPERGPACLIGIVTDAQPGVDYTAKLVYDLETACTTTTVSPCDEQKVRELGPSPSAPVLATWQYVETVVACFVARPSSSSDPDNPDTVRYYEEETTDPPSCPARSGN